MGDGCIPGRLVAVCVAMIKLLGVLLIAAGSAALHFGGIPWSTRETVVQIGSLKAERDVDKSIKIPPQASAGAVGVGVLLLLLTGGKKR